MLGSFPPLRGLSSYCLGITAALVALVRVEFISFKKIYPRFLYPGGKLENDHTFPVPNTKGLRVRRRLTWYNPVTWIMEAMFSDAELLHAQWWSLPLVAVFSCICAIFKLRGKPVVFTIHNVLSHERSYFFKTASKLLFKLGDHFIVHTEKNRQQLITHYGIRSELISIIPHGILDFHVHTQISRSVVREELGIGPNKKVILLFGAIRPYKGVQTALEALSKVLPEVPDSVLLIAGKLWQSWEPYQLLIDRLNINKAVITIQDYVPSGDVCRYFEASDLVILPYDRFDSQSGVGSTAVAFRKPMIVSDVGGLPELVTDRRCIVPPKDPAALARAIIASFSNPDRLAKMTAGTEVVAKRLSWPAIAQKTITIYDELLNHKQKTSY